MSSTHDLSNPSIKAGDVLRDEAANLLGRLYQNVETERYVGGKDVDIYYEEDHYGTTVCRFVEVKDVSHNLSNGEVSAICAEYATALRKNPGSLLLIVSRNGLTGPGRDVIRDHPDVRHMTIWDLESHVLGLTAYIRHIATLFSADGLDQYYVRPHANEVEYDKDQVSSVSETAVDLVRVVRDWIEEKAAPPFAITGTYGSGKSSFAKMLATELAKESLADPTKRKPILIELGEFNSHNKIEGILGAKITTQFRCPNFNFPTFEDLNRKGRLVIILDGFDEMKHAMHIDDFYRQMRSINGLVVGDSKLLLLGRPNAFTTNDEEIYVLRGMKRQVSGEGYSPYADAIKYRHYRIAPFTPAQTNEFVEKYLRTKTLVGQESLSEEEIKSRSDEVKRLVNGDPELFGKPVHVRIIADLARVPAYDLGSFSAKASRWQLYDDFFDSLLDREVSKEGRDRIRKTDRRDFLERLAKWLWRSRDGVTSFRVEDLPSSLLSGIIPVSQTQPDERSLFRELLMGPIIERKGDDIFYFGHRSFAEYLIAESLYRKLPAGQDHTVYSSVFRDGVATFLQERAGEGNVCKWIETLLDSKAAISLDYLRFIVDSSGGLASLIAKVGPETPLGKVFQCFGEKLEFTAEVVDALHKVLIHPQQERFLFATALLNLSRFEGYYDDRTGARYIATVLDRLFNGVTMAERQSSGSIKPHFEDARAAASSLVSEVHGGAISTMTIDFVGFVERLNSLSQNYGFGFSWGGIPAFSGFIGTEPRLEYRHVLPYMKPENAEKLKLYSLRERHLTGIFIKEIK